MTYSVMQYSNFIVNSHGGISGTIVIIVLIIIIIILIIITGEVF